SLEHVGGANLLTTRDRPSLIDKMGVKDPGLGNLLFFVPDDGSIGAGVYDVFASARLLGIDDDDTIVTLANGISADLLAGRVVAMIAHDGKISGRHHWRATLNATQNTKWSIAHRRGG